MYTYINRRLVLNRSMRIVQQRRVSGLPLVVHRVVPGSKQNDVSSLIILCVNSTLAIVPCGSTVITNLYIPHLHPLCFFRLPPTLPTAYTKTYQKHSKISAYKLHPGYSFLSRIGVSSGHRADVEDAQSTMKNDFVVKGETQTYTFQFMRKFRLNILHVTNIRRQVYKKVIQIQ